MKRLEMKLLGSPIIEYGGLQIEVDTRKAEALLVYLAVTAEIHTRDALATLLWSEYDQIRARAALRRTLSSLKKALDGEFLVISRESLALELDDKVWIDVGQFQSNLAEHRSHSHDAGSLCPSCHTLLEDAVDLYRGDFLEGFTLRDSPQFDDWQFFQSEKLRRDLASILETLVESHLAQSSFQSAVAHSHRWLALDPLREDAHQALMKSYHWSGQHSAALRQYRECVRILDQELGVSPLEETTQLYREILEDRLPEPVPPMVISSEDQVSQEVLDIHLSGKPPSYPLVGRSRQSVQLYRAYERHLQTGYFFLIEGEPGVGKSRLAEEFLSSIRARGAITFHTRCYEGDSDLAYEPFILGLRQLLTTDKSHERLKEITSSQLNEATRLLPELDAHIPKSSPVPPLSSPGARTRFFESLRQVLAALLESKPMGLIFLDDLHWADSASLDLLGYLVRRLGASRFFILGAWRDEGHSSVQRLRQIFADAQRDGLAENLRLERLALEDVSDLVRSIEPHFPNIPADFGQKLHAESEGLPFFVVEYLNSLRDESGKYLDSGRDGVDWELPASIRDLLLARLQALDDTERQLITTAAVIGRSFNFNTLLRASGRSEIETVTGLEALRERSLVEERAPSKSSSQIIFDFSHAKLRQLVYAQTSQPRVRLLHRRVAEAMEYFSRGFHDSDSMASKIAYHFRLSNEGERAAEYYHRAGEYARQIYAHREAIAHFQAALSAGYPQHAVLHESIGDSLTTLAEYNAALNSFEIAASLCDSAALSRLERKLGEVHHRRGDYELAVCHFKAALDGLEQEDEPAVKSHLYADWSRSVHRLGQADLAHDLAEKSLGLAVEAEDDLAIAQAHNILGMLARGNGNYESARQHLESSLDLAENISDPFPQIAALNNLGLLNADCEELEQAIRLTQRALELCEQVGDRHYAAALLNNLADMFQKKGEEEVAMEKLRKAVVIFAEIGVETGDLKPEIWMLTEW